ncbi:SnoaL-domain-containing protein [Xylariaceae sp. FL0662B]|nr:SnoaL-domain-containing protein [Xylariaceae sp. FL0662B]
MPATASELEATLRGWAECINQKKWDEVPKHIYPKYEQNGQEYTPESFAEHAKKAMGALGENVLLNTDLIIVDESAQLATYNMWFKFRQDMPFLGFEPTGRDIIFVENRFIWFTDGKLSKSLFVINFDDMRKQLANPDFEYIPNLINTTPIPTGNVKLSRKELEETYKAYVACVQDRGSDAELGKYVHESVTINNDKVVPLEEYRQSFGPGPGPVSDSRLHTDTLIADEESQRVAARLEVTVTPAKEAVPDEHPVRFYKHTTYQFLDGKIKKAWAIMDLEEARQHFKPSE